MGERVVNEKHNRTDGEEGENDEFFSDDKGSDRGDINRRNRMKNESSDKKQKV